MLFLFFSDFLALIAAATPQQAAAKSGGARSNSGKQVPGS